MEEAKNIYDEFKAYDAMKKAYEDLTKEYEKKSQILKELQAAVQNKNNEAICNQIIDTQDRDIIDRDPNCFPIKVWQFVNRFVPRNYTVNLYVATRGVLEEDPSVPCTNWTLKWRGMEWQITMSEDEWKEYHKIHYDVQRCPYRNWWVVGITGVRKPEEPGRVDVVSIIVEEVR